MSESIWELFLEAWHEVMGEHQHGAEREHEENAAVEVVSGEEFEELMKKVEKG